MFRGRHKATDEWVYGLPVGTHVGTFIITEENPHVCHMNGYMEIDEFAEVDPSTIGQYTGMLDKYGEPIYEGDIVRFYDDIEDELVSNPVVYDEDCCSFCIDDKSKDPIGLCAHWEYEVIGNIHDKTEER